MGSVKTIGYKLDFVRNCNAESAAYLFVIIIIFIFTPIIEIKIFEQNPCFEKICSRKSISNFHTLLEIDERSLNKYLFTVIIGRKLRYV